MEALGNRLATTSNLAAPISTPACLQGNIALYARSARTILPAQFSKGTYYVEPN
jgi:hypothetical protein